MPDLKLELKKLKKALTALESIYHEPNLPNRMNVDATIQRFEFTFELFWKTLKILLKQYGREVHLPKDVLKEAYQAKFISDEDIWIKMLQDRNQTSHTYNEELADEIFDHIQLYVPLMKKTYNKIKSL